jgi:solute carrier family 5 (sodium-coupled monocarboxylate transporter), member 8/12
MPILPVSFSLMASFISSITLLGVSSEIYTYGTQFVAINLSYGNENSLPILRHLTFFFFKLGLATPVIAYLFLPVFYKLNATSAYEVI